HRFATPNQQFGAARGNFLLSGGQSQAPGPRGGPMGPPQPPPAQQRPPTMIGQQPPPQTFGQVGGNMYGQMQGNYAPAGSQLPNMGVNPGMQSVLQNRAQQFAPPSDPRMMSAAGQMGQFGGGFDPRAIQANPAGFQNWMQGAQQQEQMRPGSTMLGMGGMGQMGSAQAGLGQQGQMMGNQMAGLQGMGQMGGGLRPMNPYMGGVNRGNIGGGSFL